MKKHFRPQVKGFTLIELMVVIVIIGILASVVLVSLQNARKDALDTAITAEATNMMKAAQLEAIRAGNVYTGYGVSIASVATCNSSFGSAPDPSGMRKACESIVTKALTSSTNGWADRLWVSTWGGSDTLAIMALLPGAQKYYCIGSKGATSSSQNLDGSGCGGTAGTWLCPGCAGNN